MNPSRIVRTIAAGLLWTGCASAVAGPIYRCSSGGAVSYQEQPCATGEERVWEVPAYPPVNLAERERLLQREAALDARLLKRAELESAERIAREARRERELEAALAAERERARAAEAVPYAIPLYLPMPRRIPARPVRPPPRF